jgi:Glycosyltransferases involved in cell wall biogenesis
MSAARTPGLISVTAPVLNEEEIVEEFYTRVRNALAEYEWELVLVNDGSTDSTPQLLDELAARDERVKVVHLARNFGYQPAVIAGLDHCRGDVVVTIDADLQDPPELIHEMLDRWREGSDVVYAVRRERLGEGRVKLLTARWFSTLFTRLAELDIPANAGDYRLLDRRAVDALLRMRERSRFMRGMTVWVGFTQSSVEYDRDPRYAGETRYRWRTLLRISLDAISSFSHVPLQIATVVGFIVSFIAFLGIPYVVVSRLFNLYVEGLSTVLFAILFLGGIQLITLGIIGEYISRIYDEVKRRPLYLVGERRNLDGPYPGLADFDPQTHRAIGPGTSRAPVATETQDERREPQPAGVEHA